MGVDHVMVVGQAGGLEALIEDEVLLNRLAPVIKLVQDPSLAQGIQVPPFRDYGYLHSLLGQRNDGERPIFAHFRGAVKDTDRLRLQLRTLAQQRPHRFYWKEGLSAFYWQELARSRFILCPHGHVRRIYDAMHAGAIPVVINDDWRLPREVEAGCLRVKERDAYKLDQILMDVQPEEEQQLLSYNAANLHRWTWNLKQPQAEDPFEQVMATLAQLKYSDVRPDEHNEILTEADVEDNEGEDEERLDLEHGTRIEL